MLTLLDTTNNLSLRGVSIIEFFHEKDPEVLVALGKSMGQDRPDLLKRYYLEAVENDSQNFAYFKDYLDVLIATNDTKGIAQALARVSDMVATTRNVDLLNPSLSVYYTKELFEDIGTAFTFSKFISKFYYFIGLRVISTNPLLTRHFWTIASELSPWWSYYSIELAGLEHYILYNDFAARKILMKCQQNIYAKENCSSTLKYFADLPQVGSYQIDIKNIW
jgi:hypothetical protein